MASRWRNRLFVVNFWIRDGTMVQNSGEGKNDFEPQKIMFFLGGGVGFLEHVRPNT